MSSKDQDEYLNSPDHPLPDLLTALRHDNKDTIMALLSRDPFTQVPSPSVTWTQRLIFSTDELRHLILRQVLGDPGSWNSSSAMALAKRKKRAAATAAVAATANNNNATTSGSPNKSTCDGIFPKGMGIRGSKTFSELFRKNNNNNNNMDSTNNTLDEKKESSPSSSDLTITLNSSSHYHHYGDYTPTPDEPNSDVDAIIYFLHPTPLSHTRLLSSYIKSQQLRSPRRQMHRIVYLPHSTSLNERLLEEETVIPAENVSVEEVQLDLVPLDRDVVSIEMPNVVRDCDVEGVKGVSVASVARSIQKVQEVCGTIRRMQGLGPLGEAVIEIWSSSLCIWTNT